ncbi:MAG TPA: hypothetical protein VEB22_02760, partial [Phycisphaerales bacterium]|nr:hypothetical protein [Phycisphaerales bacterium]
VDEEWTITIPAGTLSVTLDLTVEDDTTAENPETAVVNLVANPAYRLGTPAQRTGTVTIADNEPMVTLSVVDGQAAEHFTPAVANGGQFRVTRPTTNTAGDLVVHFTMSGSAGIEGEYTLVAVAGGGAVTYDPDTGEGTVTILSGDTTGLVNLVVTNDAVVELAETAIMTLVGTDEYRVSTVASQRIGTVTIADNEPVISLQATDNTAAEGLINGVPNFGNFRISRTGDISEQLTINVVVTGTAVNGDWINFIETEMVIPAGQSFYDNPVVPVDDALWENADTIIITLATGDGYTLTSTASQRTATVTIADNENTIAVRAQDATAAEVTGGAANPGQFRFSRTGGTNTAAVTVHFSLAGSALTSDYALAAGAAGANLQFDADTGLGSITIPAGAASVDLNLTAVDDVTGEAVETAVLTLVEDASYRLSLTASQRTATVRINDNEATVVLTTNDRTGAEVTTGTANGGRYTFTRSLASNAAPLTVFFTVTGTATPTLDFSLAAFTAGATLDFDPDTGLGSITIPAGTNVAVLNLNVVDDLLVESAETAILTVTEGDGYRLGATAAQRTGTVTISDNEPRFAVTASDAAGAETASGSANPITFRIARTGGSNGQTSVVNFSMTGTATPGTDYVLTMNAAAGVTFDFDPVTGEGTVTFTGTATQATLVATPALDQTVEPVETVVLNLLPATDGGQEYTVSETQGSATGNLTSAVFADIAALEIGELSDTEFVFGQDGQTVSFDLSVQNLGTTTNTSVRGLVFLQRANGTRITINTANYAVNLAPGESTILNIVINLDDAPSIPLGTYTPGVTATIATGGGGTDVNAANSTITDAEQPVTVIAAP